MTSPYLILDCYYDDRGGYPNFLALLGERQARVVRCVFEKPPADLSEYSGIFITGSKGSLTAPEPWMDDLLAAIRRAYGEGIPMLGVCFGHQAIARALLGKQGIRPSPKSELGWVDIERTGEDSVLSALPQSFRCFVSHFDEVTPGVPELRVLARSERCPVEAFQVGTTPTWGVQFHPEMDPKESETLVRNNLSRHPGLLQDVERTLAERRDGRGLGLALFGNFLAVVEERCQSPRG